MPGLGLSGRLTLSLGPRYGGGGGGGAPPAPAAITGNNWEGETLTVSPAGTSRQWTRSGSPISGATAATYVVDRADVDSIIGCEVDGVAASGSVRGTLDWHARVLLYADGVMYNSGATCPGGDNAFHWFMEDTQGAYRPAVGWNLAQSGQSHAIMLARINDVNAQKPDVIIYHGSVNDIDADTAGYNAERDAILANLETNNPDAIILFCTTMREFNTATVLDAINNHELTKASGPGGGSRGAGGKGRTIVANFTPGWDTATMMRDASHPNRLGGRHMGGVLSAIGDRIMRPMDYAVFLAQTTAIPAKGLGANLVTTGQYQLSGIGGTETGTGASGDTADGFRIEHNAAGTSTAVGGKVAQTGYSQQTITLDGTPVNATSTTRFYPLSAMTLDTVANAHGRFYEFMWRAIYENTAGGGAPVGLKARGTSSFIGGLNNGLATGAVAGTFGERTDTIMRSCPSSWYSTAPAFTGNATHTPIHQIVSDAVDLDLKITLDRMIVRQIETVAYALPFLVTYGVTGNEVPGITGTAGGTNTLLKRRGRWSGGAITFSEQWDINGTPVSGATAANYAQTSHASGSVIGCTTTATNSIGSATDRRTVTVP